MFRILLMAVALVSGAEHASAAAMAGASESCGAGGPSSAQATTCLKSTANGVGVLKINDHNDGVLACVEQRCESVKAPVSFAKNLDNGYEHIEIEQFGSYEFVLLATAHDVNSCGKLYALDEGRKALIEIGPQDFCNLRGESRHVVSSHRDAGKWTENVYALSGGALKLAYSDECVGCGRIKRTDYTGLAPQRYLVSDVPTFADRRALTAVMHVEKGYLYHSPDASAVTKAYLIKGDRMTLLDEADTAADGSWYLVRFDGGEKPLIRWVRRSDVE